ncbi:hypothetical protein CesoFtcFv8_022671 [Champsocephalus esox]|uniref:Uncharacterized protein n=1 Tax=Champsocephalus esox TaxID=159716 RepID=A0AAN8B6N4_9TELE|nr:hypothetical protein CesoFtcFv8_022671 [Champsocephalus esox]
MRLSARPPTAVDTSTPATTATAHPCQHSQDFSPHRSAQNTAQTVRYAHTPWGQPIKPGPPRTPRTSHHSGSTPTTIIDDPASPPHVPTREPPPTHTTKCSRRPQAPSAQRPKR